MLFKGFVFVSTLLVILVQCNAGSVEHVLGKCASTKEKQCTTEGLMCDDCKTLVTCYKNDDGEWDKDITEYCASGRTCSSETNTCTFAQNDDCDANVVDFQFHCRQVGLFPHPFDCKKYYNCIMDEEGTVDPKSLAMECKNGYGYDPLTTICRQRLVNGDCPKRLLEPCHNVGRIDPIEGNPYLYSICLIESQNEGMVYLPNIFACIDNEIFIEDQCVKPVSGVDEDGRCLRIGFFYDPDDCKKYKECLLSGLRPNSRSCIFGYEFNKFSKVCETFKCKK